MPSSDTYFKKGQVANPKGSSKKSRERAAVRRQLEEMLGKAKMKSLKPKGKKGLDAWFELMLEMDWTTITDLMKNHQGDLPLPVLMYFSALRYDLKNGRSGTRTIDNLIKHLYGIKAEITTKAEEDDYPIANIELDESEEDEFVKNFVDKYKGNDN